jgi:hypothetical protein
LDVPEQEVQALADALRRRLGLFSAAETRAWLGREGLTPRRFGETMRALATVGVVERRYAAAIDQKLPIHAAIAGRGRSRRR